MPGLIQEIFQNIWVETQDEIDLYKYLYDYLIEKHDYSDLEALDEMEEHLYRLRCFVERMIKIRKKSGINKYVFSDTDDYKLIKV